MDTDYLLLEVRKTRTIVFDDLFSFFGCRPFFIMVAFFR